jgi:hypothetical protein
LWGEEGKGRRQSSQQQQQQQVHSLKKKMGWLSACLGGGHTTKQKRHCSKTFVPHHRSRVRHCKWPISFPASSFSSWLKVPLHCFALPLKVHCRAQCKSCHILSPNTTSY